MQDLKPYSGNDPYVFVSYAHADEAEVVADMRRLQAMGVNVWYDAGIAPGATWREEIAQALANASRMLFYVTPNSINSMHCQQETSFSHTKGVKILAIHLEPVELPLGLELNLGDQQAILRYQMDEEQYNAKLRSALSHLLHQTAKPEQPTSELKQVTVLNVQFRTMPAGDEPVDPESYLEAISECRSRIVERVHELGGHLAVTGNDELVIHFGVPVAHEDDSERAVRTALMIRESVDQARQEFIKNFDLELDVLQGIQSGRVVVRQAPGEGLSIFGQSSNDAGGLARSADNGQVRISETVWKLVRNSFDGQSLGELNLGGKPAEVHEVLKESLVPQQLDSSGFSQIIGREQEQNTLIDRWQMAANGSGQAVLLAGEPGIGKSRLTMSLIDRIREQGDVEVITGVCSPYFTHTALHPFVGVLENILGLKAEMPGEEKLARLEKYLSSYEFGQDSPLRLFCKMLSIPCNEPAPAATPEMEKQLLFEAIINIAIQISQQSPMLLVIEDIHWADATTQELLGHLLDLLPTTRIFCLLNFRSHFTPGWAARPHIQSIALNRIPDEEAANIIRAIAGETEVDDKTVENIIARADGVPLFLEEVTRSLMDSGALAGGAKDLEIPITLQESLTARLDLLKTGKKAAQIAAVIGREFDFPLLSSIVPFSRAELTEYLTTLVRKDFVLQQGFGSSARYIFKHALIRDTAYSSLMKKDRQQYHARIAASLESEFPEISELRPELVAYHHAAVGNDEKAIEWWLKAGDKAAQNFANNEAEHHYQQALNAIPRLDGQTELRELEVLMRLVPTHVANYGYGADELEGACERALELCEKVGDDAQTVFALFGLWMFHVVRANHPKSLELAARVGETAEQLQNSDLVLEAALAQGIANFFVGNFEESHDWFSRCIEHYDEEAHGHHAYLFGQDPRVIALSYLSWLLWITGDEEAAEQASESALEFGREMGHPVSMAFALSYAAFLRLYKADFDSDEAHADELVTLRESHGVPELWLAHGNVAKAWHHGSVHDPHEGAEKMHHALTLFRDSGSRCFLPLWDTIHAEILLRAGRAEEAMEILERVEQDMVDTGELWCQSEWLRVHALAHHALGKEDHGDKLMDKAAGVAEQQGADNWLGRVKKTRDKVAD